MKSNLLASARVFPANTKFVPLLYFPNGKNRLGRWAICVAEGDLEAARASISAGNIPEVQSAIACVSETGSLAFFNVELRNFGGWFAPNIFEELDLSFDLPETTQLVGLNGAPVNASQPIKGVVFVDRSGNVINAPNGEKPKALRFNLSNFQVDGGTHSEDGRVWEVTVGGTKYTGHLYYTGSENGMRIFGMVAYVMVTDTPPARIICEEAISIVPQLVAGLAH